MSSGNVFSCEHCGGEIVLPASAEQAARCPHCGKETALPGSGSDSGQFFIWENDQQQGPFDQPTVQRMMAEGRLTKDALVCPAEGGMDWTPAKELFLMNDAAGGLAAAGAGPDSGETDSNAALRIGLCSGLQLRVKAIRLYDACALAAIGSKRNAAMEKLRGVSAGPGSPGSISWVLGSSQAIGKAGAGLSAGATGEDLLVQVMQMEKDLRDKGAVCPVHEIENIERPDPMLWRLYSPKFQTTFIHDGDDFLTVQTGDGSIQCIRWSAVESYAYQG